MTGGLEFRASSFPADFGLRYSDFLSCLCIPKPQPFWKSGIGSMRRRWKRCRSPRRGAGRECGTSLNPPRLAGIADQTIDTPAGPLRVRLYQPAEPATRGVCLYFHGRWWCLNSVDTHDDLSATVCSGWLCHRVRSTIDLRPSIPIPRRSKMPTCAAMGQGVGTCNGTSITSGLPWPGILLGQSRGGGDARHGDWGGPSIRQQVLVYPITDADFTRASYIENADGYFLYHRSDALVLERCTVRMSRDAANRMPRHCGRHRCVVCRRR